MLRNRHFVLMNEADAGEGEGGAGGTATPPAADGGEGTPPSGTVLDGGENGEGGNTHKVGDPDYQYAGKYKSVEDLENGYKEMTSLHTKKMNELNEKLKGFTGSPEEYTLPEDAPKFNDNIMDSLQEWGKENGLSQEAYEDLVSKAYEAEVAKLEAQKSEEMAKLGKDPEARIENLNDKWAATFGEEAVEWMNGKALTAADVEMFESILSANSPSGVHQNGKANVGQVAITDEQLTNAMMAKDSAGMMKMQTNPEYKAMVDEMTRKYNKQRGLA